MFLSTGVKFSSVNWLALIDNRWTRIDGPRDIVSLISEQFVGNGCNILGEWDSASISIFRSMEPEARIGCQGGEVSYRREWIVASAI